MRILVRTAKSERSGPTVSLAVFAALLGLATPVAAAIIPVTGTCTSAKAIEAANTDSDAGGACSVSGSGDDTVELSGGVSLGEALPVISSRIVVHGNGHTIERDPALFSTAVGGDGVDPCSGTGAKFRILSVASGGRLDLDHATIRYGCAVVPPPPAPSNALGAGLLVSGTKPRQRRTCRA